MDPRRIDRTRRALWVGWILGGLVPILMVGGLLVGQHLSRTIGIASLVVAGLAQLVGPPLIFGAGFSLRAHLPSPPSPTLGRIAVAFYVVMIVVLGFGIVTMFRAVGGDGSLDGLGLAIGGMMLIVVSLLPWLVSLVTGSVFTSRVVRAAP